MLEVLENSEKHLDAEALHERVRVRNPNVSLATVYRTLTVLKEMGLVEEHRLGQEHAHYEAAQDAPHYHFVCLECGRVIEFESPLVKQAIQRFSQEQGLCVTDTHVRLSGYCPRCTELVKGPYNED